MSSVPIQINKNQTKTTLRPCFQLRYAFAMLRLHWKTRSHHAAAFPASPPRPPRHLAAEPETRPGTRVETGRAEEGPVVS